MISVGVRPGMVISSSLRVSAPRSVADGGEHALVNVTGIFGCRRCCINIGGNGHGWFGSWVCMFVCDSRWGCRLGIRAFEGYHPQARLGALVSTDDRAAAIYNGAIDFCEGHCAPRVHGDNREKGVGRQAGDDMGCLCAGWEIW